jgi:hypothetical protein
MLVRVSFCALLAACAKASTPSAIGDDCSTDDMCASTLCDDNGYCADPVATTDGNPCVDDTTCPKGAACDSTTGSCFSAEYDGTGGNGACTTDSDCSGDETCDTTTGHCVG